MISPSTSTLLSPSNELKEVKQELKSLTTIVQKLVPNLSTSPPSSLASLNTPRSYSEVLKRELILLSKRSKELIISLSSKTKDEKKRTKEALVRALKDPSFTPSLEIIATRHLLSIDITITFSLTSVY